MDLTDSEKTVREAIQSHLAKGGKLVKGSFGYGRGICKCPMNLVAGTADGGDAVQLAANKLGWDTEEVWYFIFGFDGVDDSPAPQCEMGRRFAAEFKDYVV